MPTSDRPDAPTPPGRGGASPAGPGRRWSGVAGLAATAAVIAALILGAGVLLHGQTYQAPSGTQVARRLGAVTVDGMTLPHVLLHLATYPDASGTVNGTPIHPGGNPSWPAYGPTDDFEVPAHALVTVDIKQYDGGGTITNPWFATVRGTVGGVMTVDGRSVRSINPNQVAHTFTLRGLPGGEQGFFLNVPLPDVATGYADSGKYRSVVFSFVSGATGLYVWNCEFPCGSMVTGFGGAMGALGYMSGFVRVV